MKHHQVQFYLFLAATIISTLIGGWWRDHYPPPNNEFGMTLYWIAVFLGIWTIVNGVKIFSSEWVAAEERAGHAQRLKNLAEEELRYQRRIQLTRK